jgi:hypothetical protein
MLRDCKRCGAIGLAVCACVVGGETVQAMAAEPVNLGGFAIKMDDQPHAHIETDVALQVGLRGIRPGYTAAVNFTHFWRTPWT